MAPTFAKDPFPGKPKILFIGLPQSSHTHAWIDLLKDQEFNVRLFGLPTGIPPADWKVKTYISLPNKEDRHNHARKQLYLPGRAGSLQKKTFAFLHLARDESNLARVIRDWKPDIVHTLGLDPASYFYGAVREKFDLGKIGKWLVQIRGGSDLALKRHHPDARETIRRTLAECDQVIFDNPANGRYLDEIGVPRNKFAKIAPVPGSGGIDLEKIPAEPVAPSRRERIIVWPKAYECPWSKALPVLAAIQSSWGKIVPCEIYLLAAAPEVAEWYQAWPGEIRRHGHVFGRVARDEIFSLLARARVMLAPSLIDGVPNTLYEAMAYGAFPIVSPLETISPVVQQEENVLFARNLYADEIAAALVRAMTDDALADRAAQNNLQLVAEIANRKTIRKKVIAYYLEITNI
jgi:glycosyltransferase involved in cell wall biosynthesis